MSALLFLMLSSSPQAIVCPPEIIDRQTVVVSDKRWSIRIPDMPRPLEMVTVFSGNPKNRQSLMGKRTGDRGMRWEFKGADVWIQCRYQGSSAIVTGRVGIMKSCEYHPPEAGTNDPAGFSCNP